MESELNGKSLSSRRFHVSRLGKSRSPDRIPQNQIKHFKNSESYNIGHEKNIIVSNDEHSVETNMVETNQQLLHRPVILYAK